MEKKRGLDGGECPLPAHAHRRRVGVILYRLTCTRRQVGRQLEKKGRGEGVTRPGTPLKPLFSAMPYARNINELPFEKNMK